MECMEFIKQHKGTALDKVHVKHLDPLPVYYCSIKRDGQMIQIAYHSPSHTVRMWSSNGHEFIAPYLAASVRNNNVSFHIEAEYTGPSEGMMDDRGKSSKITTYRTQFNKNQLSPIDPTEKCWVFDILSYDSKDVRGLPFSERLALMDSLHFDTSFQKVDQMPEMTIEEVQDTMLAGYVVMGYEGCMLTHKDHTIGTAGRSKQRLKLKVMGTDYAEIVGTVPGKNAREGTIGALILRDDEGKEFSAGTGLNAKEWVLEPNDIIGIRVKFGWESIKDGNYIQPRYLGVGKNPDCRLDPRILSAKVHEDLTGYIEPEY